MRLCSAVPAGYAAAPVDVFACGICAFLLAVGKPPWTVAMDTDPSFSFTCRHGVGLLDRSNPIEILINYIIISFMIYII